MVERKEMIQVPTILTSIYGDMVGKVRLGPEQITGYKSEGLTIRYVPRVGVNLTLKID